MSEQVARFVMRQRESNMELLRLMAMFLIVLNHFASHGYWPDEGTLLVSDIVLDLFQIGGRLGVDLFVLISGYFLVTAGFKFRSMMRVVAETALYWLFFATAFLVFAPDFSASVNVGVQWFPITYTGMFLFVPWLNLFISRVSQGELGRLLVLGFVVFSLIPTLSINFVFSSFVWFLYLYLFAAYIRLYGPPSIMGRPGVLLALCLGFIVLSIVALNFLGTVFLPAASKTLFFREMNMVPTFGLAAAILLLMRSVELGAVKPINTAASTTFGIYLISDNCFVRAWVLSQFSWVYFLPLPTLIVACVGFSFAYFCACGVVDYLRQRLIKALPVPARARESYLKLCARADAWFNYMQETGVALCNERARDDRAVKDFDARG